MSLRRGRGREVALSGWGVSCVQSWTDDSLNTGGTLQPGQRPGDFVSCRTEQGRWRDGRVVGWPYRWRGPQSAGHVDAAPHPTRAMSGAGAAPSAHRRAHTR